MVRRRLLIVVLLVLVVLLVVGVIAVRSLLSPERFTALLRDQAHAQGLQIQLAGPASPSLWPHLAVRLNDVHLRREGVDAPMLTADEAFLVVPWSGLLGDDVRIEKLQINAPVIDLEQVRAWLAEREQRPGQTSGVQLPTVEAGMHVSNATLLQGRKLLLKSLNLVTGKFKPGQPFSLDIKALDKENRPLALTIDTVPTQIGESIALNPLKLYLAAGAPPSLRLQGRLRWSGGSQLAGALQGTLQLAQAEYASSIETQATPEGGMRLHVLLDGKGSHMDLSLEPDKAWRWWQQISADDGSSVSLPPIRGSMTAEKVELGDLKIRGLHVQSDPLAPAATADRPAAAASITSP